MDGAAAFVQLRATDFDLPPRPRLLIGLRRRPTAHRADAPQFVNFVSLCRHVRDDREWLSLPIHIQARAHNINARRQQFLDDLQNV